MFGGFRLVSLQIEIDDYKAIDFNIFVHPFWGGLKIADGNHLDGDFHF